MLASYYEMFHEIFEQIEWRDFPGYFNWIRTVKRWHHYFKLSEIYEKNLIFQYKK